MNLFICLGRTATQQNNIQEVESKLYILRMFGVIQFRVLIFSPLSAYLKIKIKKQNAGYDRVLTQFTFP
jgi:hypothetical protein